MAFVNLGLQTGLTFATFIAEAAPIGAGQTGTTFIRARLESHFSAQRRFGGMRPYSSAEALPEHKE